VILPIAIPFTRLRRDRSCSTDCNLPSMPVTAISGVWQILWGRTIGKARLTRSRNQPTVETGRLRSLRLRHMFHTLMTLLTAATFVAHGLLGCCWHHAHSHVVDGEPGSVSEVVCVGHHDHCAHSDHAVPAADSEVPQDTDHCPPPSPRCEESDCIVLGVLVSSTSGVGTPLSFFAVPLLGLPFVPVPLPNLGRQGLRTGSGSPPSQAPLHALSQVWLI
jgi:hypothetical protein